MDLTIFDLDNTLLHGDSDYLWGEFLVEHGYVEKGEYQKENTRYYNDYVNGRIDIIAFTKFQFRCLKNNDMETLRAWRKCFIKEKIQPIILDKAVQLIEEHRSKNHILLIITATNSFITQPIAKLLNIDQLIATEPQIIDGQYSGEINGTPSFAEGKVICYQQWLQEHDLGPPSSSYFYSDSHNDIPLLKTVSNPVAVDPDDRLTVEAKKQGWPIISLR